MNNVDFQRMIGYDMPMNKGTGPINTVNQNDNHISSWLWKGDRQANQHYAVYIPLADAIIRNHCTLWYKTQPQTSEYQHMQMNICSLLYCGRECYGSDGTLQLIASVIECRNSLSIVNDPNIDLKGIL
jgi:hypothetical protein